MPNTDGSSSDAAEAFAEQVAVVAVAADVSEVFLDDCAVRLAPLLALAWAEGLGVLAMQVILNDAQRAARSHALTVEPAPPDDSAAATYVMQWNVLGPPLMFTSIEAELSVQPTGATTVLGLRGTAHLAPGSRYAAGMARRPVEAAVRALLGHIRNAVESGRSVRAGSSVVTEGAGHQAS